jgi:uncharacterized protein
MAIVDDVSAAITDAMRRQDAARLSALRMLKAAMMNRSVEKGRDLDDAEARQVVSALVKQRRDSIEQFLKGGRRQVALEHGNLGRLLVGQTVDGKVVNELVRRKLAGA